MSKKDRSMLFSVLHHPMLRKRSWFCLTVLKVQSTVAEKAQQRDMAGVWN